MCGWGEVLVLNVNFMIWEIRILTKIQIKISKTNGARPLHSSKYATIKMLRVGKPDDKIRIRSKKTEFLLSEGLEGECPQ